MEPLIPFEKVRKSYCKEGFAEPNVVFPEHSGSYLKLTSD